MTTKAKKTPPKKSKAPAKKPAPKKSAPRKAKKASSTKKKSAAKKAKKKKRNVVLFIPKPEQQAKPSGTAKPRIAPWPCAGRTASRAGFAGARLEPPLAAQWRAKLAAPARTSPVVSEEGHVYVADSEGELRAIDLENGKTLWKLRTDRILGRSPAWPLVAQGLVPGDRVPVSSSPAIHEWHLFFGDDEGIFYCLRRGEAQVIWRKLAPLSMAARGGEGYRAPLVVGGSVFTVDADGNLYAGDARNGTTLFSRFLRGRPASAPVVTRGLVLVATRPLYPGEAPTLHAIDATTGDRRWHVDLPGLPGPALAGADGRGAVIVGGDFGVAAWSLERGERLWHTALPAIPQVESGLALDGSRVIATTAEGFIALDVVSGAPLVQSTLKKPAVIAKDTSPAVAGNVVWLAAQDAVIAFEVESGKELGRLRVRGTPRGGPVLAAGGLLVASDQGEVAFFRSTL